jgi:hypothetical protein
MLKFDLTLLHLYPILKQLDYEIIKVAACLLRCKRWIESPR